MIKKKLLSIIALAVVTSSLVNAQSPVSGFMQGKGKGNVVISSGMEKYSKVYLVPKEVNGVPVFNEVEISSTSLYATYGLTDKLDVVFSLPYVSAQGNASDAVLSNLNFENERNGIQDISLYVKYNPLNYDFGSSKLSFSGALGFKTPLGDYKADEGLQSIIAIGNRNQTLNLIGISMFKTNSGLFASGQFGTMLSLNSLPNVIMSEIKLGYAASKIYGDVFLASQTSTSGVDILGEGFTAYFPDTKVNATRLGANIYAPIYKSFGLATGLNTYVAGRNLGKATGFYGAIIYKF